jgi:hypothetical protein
MQPDALRFRITTPHTWNLLRTHQFYPCPVVGYRRSISAKISSAQRIESAMALTVAGTRFPPSYCASFLAAKIDAAISRTRFRPSSILGLPGRNLTQRRLRKVRKRSIALLSLFFRLSSISAGELLEEGRIELDVAH